MQRLLESPHKAATRKEVTVASCAAQRIDALEERLKGTRNGFRRVLVVVEGAYSMDGDYPDMPRLVELREKYKFWLMVDEAHSFGCLGATGRGIAEHCGGIARDKVDLWTGTLSKSLASCGGFVAGRHQLIDWNLDFRQAWHDD